MPEAFRESDVQPLPGPKGLALATDSSGGRVLLVQSTTLSDRERVFDGVVRARQLTPEIAVSVFPSGADSVVAVWKLVGWRPLIDALARPLGVVEALSRTIAVANALGALHRTGFGHLGLCVSSVVLSDSGQAAFVDLRNSMSLAVPVAARLDLPEAASRIGCLAPEQTVSRSAEPNIKLIAMLTYVDEEFRPDLVDAFQAAVFGGVPFHFEYSVGLGTKWVEMTAEVVRDNAGEVSGVSGVSTDVTRRMIAQSKSIEMVTQLEHGQRMESLGLLAGGVAHDVSNMLQVVQLNAAMVRDERDTILPDSLLNSMGNVLHASDRAQGVLNKLLTFAKQKPNTVEAIQLNAVVRRMAELLQITVATETQVCIELMEDLPLVLIDLPSLEQALVNLGLNARDAMGDAGVLTLGARTLSFQGTCASCHEPVSGDFVEVWVGDTGRGIAPQLLPRIFEPFVSTKGDQGTGLGLPTVHGTIHTHGGHIRVYFDSGMVFGLLLPVVPVGGGDS